MRRLWLALVLVGCGGAEPEVVAERPSFRDQSVPIASQVDVQPTDLVGWWRIRATTEPAMVGGGFVVRFDDRRRLMSFRGASMFEPLDGPGQFDRLEEDAVTLSSLGPGRLMAVASPFAPSLDFAPFLRAVIGSADEADIWILWADADRRTLAIGTPDGSFGFILDREPSGGEDRITAALDIMAWMGYRTEEMEGL